MWQNVSNWWIYVRSMQYFLYCSIISVGLTFFKIEKKKLRIDK